MFIDRSLYTDAEVLPVVRWTSYHAAVLLERHHMSRYRYLAVLRHCGTRCRRIPIPLMPGPMYVLDEYGLLMVLD